MSDEFEEFLGEGADAGAWQRVDPPRPLSSQEERLIDALLAHEFPGRDQLRQQLPSVRVLATARQGDPSIKMSPSREPRLAAPVVDRVPVEAVGTDVAGNQVTVLLHVVSGYLGELEVIGWEGGSLELLPPEGLTVY